MHRLTEKEIKFLENQQKLHKNFLIICFGVVFVGVVGASMSLFHACFHPITYEYQAAEFKLAFHWGCLCLVVLICLFLENWYLKIINKLKQEAVS